MSKSGVKMRKVEKCEECGKKMRRVVQERYQYLESGLSNVVLRRIAAHVCECGEQVVALPNVERLHGLIFEKILMKESAIRGDELRFLRKTMGLKGVDFARMVKVDPTTLSKWEAGTQAISDEHDKLIRFAVVLTVSARAKQEVVETHQRVADQYLDLLGKINAIPASETGNPETVEISEDDLQDSPLTFRWGLQPPTVELIPS